MGLKDRLGRLGPGAPLGRQERERALSPEAREAAGGVSRQSTTAAGALGGASVLEELRSKMAAILQKEPSAAGAPARPVGGVLPFQDVDEGRGVFAQRLQQQRASAHVGRMPLSAALDADVEMLSLLALDPGLAAGDSRGALFFDTETTGLGGAGTVAFLIGLAWFDAAGALHLEQLFVREPSQEEAVLRRVAALIERSSLLVSFNGKSFDWPLLQARCVMNRLEPLPSRPHLDLLHVSRRLHKRRLSRCRLVDMEAEVLGWERGEDDIPGAEIAPRYGHFLRTGDEEALRPVVDHNAWDVLTMVALVGLYGEPLENLRSHDLLGVSETLTRAKAYDQAERAITRALSEGQGAEALQIRARLNKARGDKARALLDFETLSRDVDDPSIRLELAKLFEHHQKDFARALEMVEAGTGEDEEAAVRRRDRLERRAEALARRRARGRG